MRQSLLASQCRSRLATLFRRWTGSGLRAAVLSLGLFASAAHAQDDDNELSFPDTPVSSIGSTLREPTNVNPSAGIDGRFGYWALPSFGRDTGIAPLELFPYIQSQNQILFGDLRGFISNDGLVGGNFGAGWRFIEPNDLVMFGVNGWYDVDDTTGELFHQLGFGGEVRMERVGLAANAYFPIGDTEQLLRQSVSNVRFDDNEILFDVSSKLGVAMRGVDLKVNAYLPGDFCEDHEIQATGGWYHFQADNAKSINGFLVQVEGAVFRSIYGQVLTTHDNTFGTNVTIGMHWRFGTGGVPNTDLRGQMRRFIDRNYNIIVDTKRSVEEGVTAINPLTGQAYQVGHVGPGTGTGLGTISDPFSDVNDAQQSGADIIYVHNGTTITDTITLAEGQYLLGQGTSHQLRDQRYGRFTLQGDSSGATPVINAPGHGVIMADNSWLSGFTILGAGGDGIVANDVDNIRITDVEIIDPTGNGITITGGSGLVMRDVKVSGSAGHGVVIDGVEDGDIQNLLVENAGEDAVRLVDIDDVLELRNVTVRGAAGNGVHIVGGYGNIGFSGLTDIEGAALAGFAITGLETLVEVDDKGTPSTSDDVETRTLGVVQVDDLKIDGAVGANGIQITDSEGYIYFRKANVTTESGSALFVRDSDWIGIASGNLSSTDAPVMDLEDARVTISLSQIMADGGTEGIRMVRTAGTVAVLGASKDDNPNDDIGIGGLIKNTDVAVYMEDSGNLGLLGVNFKGNGVVADVSDSESLQIAYSMITETSDQIVDATNMKLVTVSQSTFENNTLSSGTGISFVADKDGSYAFGFEQNLVKETAGTFLKVMTDGAVTGAKLTASIQSNSMTMKQALDVATHVDWTGLSQVVIAGNDFIGNATNQTAVKYNAGTSTAQSQLLVQQNRFTMGGANSIGVDILSNAPSAIQIISNEMIFNGVDGIGIQAEFKKAAGVSILANSIKDNGGGLTGILFPSVYKGSTIAISGNTIDLRSASAFIDRGIILSEIAGPDDPFITFSSSANNTILGASTELFVPDEGVKGRLIINNVVIQ